MSNSSRPCSNKMQQLIRCEAMNALIAMLNEVPVLAGHSHPVGFWSNKMWSRSSDYPHQASTAITA
jgi:hypothetical protein